MTPIEAQHSTKPGWRFGVFEVDTRRGELRRSGIPIKLREQSFQILIACSKTLERSSPAKICAIGSGPPTPSSISITA